MMCCGKCGKLMGILLVLLGVLFLIADLGYWTFFGINWWTVLFLLAGLAHIGMSACGGCKDACSTKKK